jgi:hypothetical protein
MNHPPEKKPMKTNLPNQTWILVVTTLLGAALCETARSQNSAAFTYSGHLREVGQPANGPVDLRFRLFVSRTANLVSATVTNARVAVSNGTFVTSVDFGPNVFTGRDYWLELGVRPAASIGDFTILEPRQPITRAPYALWAAQSAEAASAQTAAAVTAGSIGNGALANGAVTTEKIFDGTIEFNDLSVPAQNAFWRASGNAGTTAGTHFLGTTDNQSLELKVNNQPALRLEYATDVSGNPYPNVKGGISGTISTFGSVIAGGYLNAIATKSGYSAVGGGYFNTIGTNSGYSVIGGGYLNKIAANSPYAIIPGGRENSATNRAFAAGWKAKANHTGAFVWADSQNANFASTSANQFLIRAAGGVGIGTSSPDSALTVAGTVHSTSGGFEFPDGSVQATAAARHAIESEGGALQDVVLADAAGNVSIGAKFEYGPPVTDQQCSANQTNTPAQSSSQSFTAGKTGKLDSLGAYVNVVRPGGFVPAALVIRVFEGPNTSGRELGGGSLGFASSTAGPVSVPLSGVGVVAGKTYTWSAQSSLGLVRLSYGIGNPYAGGTAGHDAGADFWFRTAVAPTLSMTGSALRVVDGRVGIGTTTPLYDLEVHGSSRFYGDVNTSGDLEVHGQSRFYSDVNLHTVVGGYVNVLSSSGNEVIKLDADHAGGGRIVTQVLQITGGSDLSEQFNITVPGGALEPGLVVCIDPENPGQLVSSTRAYDRTAAGVISGAGGVQTGMLMGQPGTLADGQHPVALTGRAYCLADASHGAIGPGDLLTTSATPGHAMKVTDHARAQGAVIGKAMTGLAQGRGLVLILVTLQ